MITKINPFAQIYEAFRGFTEPGAFYHYADSQPEVKLFILSL